MSGKIKSAGRADRWKTFTFDLEDSTPKCAQEESKCLRPVQKPTAKRNHSTLDSNSFFNKISPKTVADLAVHPKKVQEVEDWLTSNAINNKERLPLLLVSGPAGSGKTSTINLLCKKLKITISEWLNPMDREYEFCKAPGQINSFREFLTESKWNSLFSVSDTKRITLVKDFPNAVVHDPETFFEVLEECYYKTKYPIVFICTDASTNGINLARILFPDDIINKYNISHISFNACAASLMKKVLKQAIIVTQENSDSFKQPSSSTMDAILASSMGDIRSATNQLYFACLLGTNELPTVKTTKVGSKRKRTDSLSVKHMSRNESLGLFHGLGRVLNPKRTESGTSWKLNCNLDELIDEFSVQPATIISFLFENYLSYFGDIKDACKAVELLSCSERSSDSGMNRHETLIFALWTCVLGLMVFNEHKVSKWNQIRGPTKLEINKVSKSDGTVLNATDYFYYNKIRKTESLCKYKTNL